MTHKSDSAARSGPARARAPRRDAQDAQPTTHREGAKGRRQCQWAPGRAPAGLTGHGFNTRATPPGDVGSPTDPVEALGTTGEPRVVQRPAFCTKVAGGSLAWALAWRTFLLCHSLPSSLPPRGEKSHMHMMTRPSAARATATEARITRTTRPSRRKSYTKASQRNESVFKAVDPAEPERFGAAPRRTRPPGYPGHATRTRSRT